ncbi:MAG: hypothetical protein HYX68_15650 [Planctomycetes bacterium]|nr:hypothetical protein [Planctomycetota bacterium]
MNQIKPWYIVAFLLCVMGTWGCSQQKTGAISAKINELESRYSKLEADYRTLQATHELHRKKLAQIETRRVSLEKEKTELSDQVAAITTERDTLRKQVAARIQERDAAQNNLVQFTKDLQALAGRMDAALNNQAPGANTTIIPASRRNE